MSEAGNQEILDPHLRKYSLLPSLIWRHWGKTSSIGPLTKKIKIPVAAKQELLQFAWNDSERDTNKSPRGE